MSKQKVTKVSELSDKQCVGVYNAYGRTVGSIGTPYSTEDPEVAREVLQDWEDLGFRIENFDNQGWNDPDGNWPTLESLA